MKRITTILLMILTLSTIVSCVPKKRIVYFQNETGEEYSSAKASDYKVVPGDVLNIKVVSVDEKTMLLFENRNTVSSLQGDGVLYYTGYTVAEDGFVDVPTLGRVEVHGLTCNEIQDTLTKQIREIVRDATVYVKLALFHITIIGEVKNPGKYSFQQPEVNIFEALAQAGDATDFANKREIRIVHQSETGSIVKIVNINDAEILTSPDYYLQPNDIIYVEPLKMKQWGFTSFPYSTIIAVASFVMSLLTYLKVSN